MGLTSIWHWVIVLVIVLVLFGGKGKISSLMGDVGKGLRNFKSGLKDGEAGEASDTENAAIEADKSEKAPEAKSDEAAKG